MDLVDTFVLPLPIDRAWDLLLDLERIAPCLPGAQLTEIEGEEHRGKVKIKVGPITAQFAGVARFTERDAEAHRAVITAEGREARGQGNANALITAKLTAVDGPAGPGASTSVEVLTELTISGKIAQFGRGVIADVSSKLITQFVANVEAMINADSIPADSAPAASPAQVRLSEAEADREEAPAEPAAQQAAVDAAPAVRRIHSAEAAPADLLGLTGAPLAKRLAPLAGAAAAIAVLVVLLRRRSR